MHKKTKILSEKEIKNKIISLAWQIYENNSDQKEIIIVGISGRGEVLARHLVVALSSISSIKISTGVILLNKDNPYDNEILLDISEEKYTRKVIILVDDVLNSGKTLMYAAKYFLTTPLIKLSTVVLVDRNHNRYPIKSDYVGLSLATTLNQYISVLLEGDDQGVYLS